MVARSRFELLSPGFFSLYRDPEPEIPSPTSIPWRLATRFGISSFLSKYKIRPGYIACAYEPADVDTYGPVLRLEYTCLGPYVAYMHLTGYKINHKGQVFVFTASNLFPSLQDHILNLPSFAYKE